MIQVKEYVVRPYGGLGKEKQTIIYMNHPTTFKGCFGSATMYYKYSKEYEWTQSL